MAYVPVSRIDTGALSDAAEQRWAAILALRPDLEPAVALQRRLITIIVSAAETIEAAGLPRLSLPPRYLSAKLRQGVPALAAEPIPVPVAALTPVLGTLCEALAAGGAGEAAEHIRDTLVSGGIEPASLLTASLTRNQTAIRTGAAHRGLAPDLVWLIAELAVGPFAHALQRSLFAHPGLAEALDHWNRGYCPSCGSWPALAEVVGGHRTLRCSFCATAWELNTYACVYCGESGEPFVTAAPDEANLARRIEVCQTCAGYLKTVDVPSLSPFPLLAISDLETMDLDMEAMEHNYRRPEMKAFSRANAH
ncbi:MAG TPA: formate dehydrogenase accessory protein FdhE [Vicinamibacterales bacterium]|jgi:FdhE protein|nr:formate dehydrogenase accessory protein FdhE [Vicinamibacterales bacterium]